MDELSGILMISVNDRVCEGFAQGDFNVALAPGTQPQFLNMSMSLSTKGEIAATLLGKERSSSMQGPR